MKEKKLYLSNFILKIIACLAMTLDHFGVLFETNLAEPIYYLFRILGRIAFPLFVFLLIEGLTHTKNIKKYLFRLGIMALIIYISLFLFTSPFLNLPNTSALYRQGNIFVELLLYGLIYFFLINKKKYMKLLSLLPISLYFILSTIKLLTNINIIYTPLNYLYNGFFVQYDFRGIFIFGIILLGYYINDLIVKKRLNDEDLYIAYKESNNYQFRKNISCFIGILIISIIYYLISKIPTNYNITDFGIESYIILSAIFIIFYNGKLGYSNKYIQGAFYLYYPLHLVIIFLLTLI